MYPIKNKILFNPIALRTAKTLWSFGRSECNRVKLSFDKMTKEIGTEENDDKKHTTYTGTSST